MVNKNVTKSLPECTSDPPADSNLNEMTKCERRLCPLCQSPIRLFYINFHEKFLMCENVRCEFPFGHEELKIVDVGGVLDDETSNLTEVPSSAVSGKVWKENEIVKRLLDAEDAKPENTKRAQKSKIRKLREEDAQILKNINDIRELNEELLSLNEELQDRKKKEDDVKIRNEKWIKNLRNLQEMSGVMLLKPEEMVVLKKKEPEIGLGELKFNIIGEGNSSSVSEIRIEIHNPPESDETPKPDKPTGKDPLPI